SSDLTGEPEAEPHEDSLYRRGNTGADDGRGGDVAKPLAQLLRVLGGEGDVWAHGLPRLARPQQQVEQAEQRDGEVEREPRRGARSDEGGRADPAHHLSPQVGESWYQVHAAEPQLPR